MARKKLRVASAKVSKMSILPRMVIAALVQLDIFIDWRMAVRAVGGSARCGATWGGPARLGWPGPPGGAQGGGTGTGSTLGNCIRAGG